METTAPLIDPFARPITYLRVSVTDRCDFRCVYCMSENMTFLPKKELLTLEELDRMCGDLRPHGRQETPHHRRRAAGAPGHHELLPRRWAAPRPALKELTLTTNGSQLRASRASWPRPACGASTSLSTRSTRQIRRDHALGPPADRC
jgi:cyclic pyranopterin phosphate synthase